MVYWYNSTSYRDDLAWAAAWLYKATSDPGYLGDVYNYYQVHKYQEGTRDKRMLVSLLSRPILQEFKATKQVLRHVDMCTRAKILIT